MAQLAKWLQEEIDEELTDLRKDTVSDLLKKDLPSDAARRMLEIRRELGKTSTKKYNAVEACICADGRVRGLLQFYGANRTGREAGVWCRCRTCHTTLSPPWIPPGSS